MGSFHFHCFYVTESKSTFSILQPARGRLGDSRLKPNTLILFWKNALSKMRREIKTLLGRHDLVWNMLAGASFPNSLSGVRISSERGIFLRNNYISCNRLLCTTVNIYIYIYICSTKMYIQCMLFAKANVYLLFRWFILRTLSLSLSLSLSLPPVLS